MAKRNPPKSLPSTRQLLNRAYGAIAESRKYLSHFHRQQVELDQRQEDFRRAHQGWDDFAREGGELQDWINSLPAK